MAGCTRRKICIAAIWLQCCCHSQVSASWPPSALSDNSSCEDLNVVDPWRFTTVVNISSDGQTVLPIFATHPPSKIKRVLVVLHGLAGDANSYFCSATGAASDAKVLDSTLVIAPWFGGLSVTAAKWSGAKQRTGKSASWSAHGAHGSSWTSGLDSDTGSVSSFTALDALVDWIGTQAPSAEMVTLAGFSAGAQLALRWSLFSSYGKGGKQRGIDLQVLVSDPSSYTYLNGWRPDSSCSELSNTGINHTCTKFTTPSDRDQCGGTYDDYKYGLSGLDAFSDQSYFASFASGASNITDAVYEFALKTVRFVFGNEDVCNCNLAGMDNDHFCYPQTSSACSPSKYGGSGCCDTFPDTFTHNHVDASCEASLQGSNRLQRGLNYMAHLDSAIKKEFGISYNASYGFFHGGHDNAAFYASAAFHEWAFGVSREADSILFV